MDPSTGHRTKNMADASGKPLVKLPELLSYQIKVKLTGAARETYDDVFKQLRKIIDKVVGSDTGGAKYSQMRQSLFHTQLSHSFRKLIPLVRVVAYLLRLRQIACDPTLCPPDFIEMYGVPFLSIVEPILTLKRFNRIRDEAQADHLQDEFKRVSGSDGSEEQMTYLRRLLHQLDEEECSVCSSLVVEARISICQHIFCQSWYAFFSLSAPRHSAVLMKNEGEPPASNTPLKRTEFVQFVLTLSLKKES